MLSWQNEHEPFSSFISKIQLNDHSKWNLDHCSNVQKSSGTVHSSTVSYLVADQQFPRTGAPTPKVSDQIFPKKCRQYLNWQMLDTFVILA